MYIVTFKRHTRTDRRGQTVPGWLTVRIAAHDPADAKRFKLCISKTYVASLLHRPLGDHWQYRNQVGATFRLRPTDSFEKFEVLIRTTIVHVNNQLAGLREQEVAAQRILPPNRYAEVA